MVNRILFLLILFFAVLKTSGQNFRAGLFSGLSISQVDGDQLSGFNKAGIRVGGFVNRKISEKFRLQFEIEFIQKGSRKPLAKDGQYYLMRLNYIGVPLLANYAINKKWSLEAGASFATLISSREENQEGIITGAPSFHRNDYLVCAGGNYYISGHVVFNVRYSYSVTTIRPKDELYSYFYYSGGQFNKVLTFSIAYQF